MINANRNLGAYESMGVPVWPDTLPDYAGPLAGFLTGLERCETPYLVTVPCDSPRFPLDLVERLADGLESQQAEIALAATREGDTTQVHPGVLPDEDVADGKPGAIHARRPAQDRPLDRAASLRRGRLRDAAAFANANTASELQQLQADG
jgi:molybdopterin-guanine dinucleotide biosynthesis protein A